MYCQSLVQKHQIYGMPKIHIGKKIRELVDKSNLSIVNFARHINLSRDGAYKIFAKEYIDTDQLRQISKVLNHDFFGHYSAELSHVKEPKDKFGFATKDDYDNLKFVVETLVKRFDEQFPEKVTKRSYEIKPKRPNKKSK